ncbi:MAG: helix-turn-helix domain-containing protein, partial [Candidatus Thorarchaeota archaeon]
MNEYQSYNPDEIGVREFPSFVRITLQNTLRKKIFTDAMKTVGKMKKRYEGSGGIPKRLFGEEKEKIVSLLSESPHTAASLIKESELSSSAVYHFLSNLRKQNRVRKEGRMYILDEFDFDILSIHEIVKIEENPHKRRKYGISVKELELAFYLWERFSLIAPEKGGYGRTYSNWYTLADAVHRWRTGRTDIPVWALRGLIDISGNDILASTGSVVQYHLPPGIPVRPSLDGEYKLPIIVDTTLDKIVVQLLQKMSKNHLYTFPKRKTWLLRALHKKFGDFHHSTDRVPSAITEILKVHYDLNTLDRSAACIPEPMKNRWVQMN